MESGKGAAHEVSGERAIQALSAFFVRGSFNARHLLRARFFLRACYFRYSNSTLTMSSPTVRSVTRSVPASPLK